MSILYAVMLSVSAMMPLPPAGSVARPRLTVERALTVEIAPAVFPDPFAEIVDALEGLPLVVIDPFQGQGMVELRGTW